MQSRFPCRCLQSARVESAISFSDSLETSRGHPRSGDPHRGRWRGRPWSLHARIAGGNCSPESAAAPPSRTARRFARPSLIPVKAASENLPGACDLVEAGPLETVTGFRCRTTRRRASGKTSGCLMHGATINVHVSFSLLHCF